MGGEGWEACSGRRLIAFVLLHFRPLDQPAPYGYCVPTVVFLSSGVLASCVSTFLIAPGQGTLDETVLASRGPSRIGADRPGPLQQKLCPDTGQSLASAARLRLFLLFGAPRDSRPSGSLPPISAAGILIDLDEHRNDGAAPD